jgi:pantoate--beta-alanine ligase
MNPIPIVRTPAALREKVSQARSTGARIALTPTMGALHRGHLSLVEIAGARAEFTIASVFVNPLQFAPSEDFAAYPRNEAHDVAQLASAGCHCVYAPTVEAIYPAGFSTTINVAGVSAALEGGVRPSHFSGVATVVAKLLIQTNPHVAIFGEKDYQQLLVIRRLAIDLDLSTEVVAAPIVREADGLALSSRNSYLTDQQRQIAPALHRTLVWAAEDLSKGAAVAETEAEGTGRLRDAGFDNVDYFEARDPLDLGRMGPGPLARPARLLAAARLGRTRLIDNLACESPRA